MPISSASSQPTPTPATPARPTIVAPVPFGGFEDGDEGQRLTIVRTLRQICESPEYKGNTALCTALGAYVPEGSEGDPEPLTESVRSLTAILDEHMPNDEGLAKTVFMQLQNSVSVFNGVQAQHKAVIEQLNSKAAAQQATISQNAQRVEQDRTEQTAIEARWKVEQTALWDRKIQDLERGHADRLTETRNMAELDRVNASALVVANNAARDERERSRQTDQQVLNDGVVAALRRELATAIHLSQTPSGTALGQIADSFDRSNCNTAQAKERKERI